MRIMSAASSGNSPGNSCGMPIWQLIPLLCPIARKACARSIAPIDHREGQPISIAGEACVNAALTTELADRRTQRARVAAHDRRAAMGENRSTHVRLGAPIELNRNRGVADQPASLYAHPRTSHRCAIADIDTDATQRFRRVRKPGDVRQVEKSFCVGRYTVSDSRRADGMLNRIRREAYSANCDCFFNGILRRSRMGKRRSKCSVSLVAYTRQGAP